MRLRTEDGRVCGERELGEIELRGGSLAASYYKDERPLLRRGRLLRHGRSGLPRGRGAVHHRPDQRPDQDQRAELLLQRLRAGHRAAPVHPRRGGPRSSRRKGRVVVLAEANHPSVLERRAQSQRQVCQAILETVGVTVSQEDVLFIRYGQLLKTSSGKLQRRAITEAYEQGGSASPRRWSCARTCCGCAPSGSSMDR